MKGLAGLWPLSLFTLGGFALGLGPTWAAGLPALGLLAESPLFWESLGYSLRTALIASALSVVLGTLLGQALQSLSRRGRLAAEVYRVPLILPHLAVGLIALLAAAPGGWLEAAAGMAGLDLAPLTQAGRFGGTGGLLILAYLFKEVPFVTLWVLAALADLPPLRLEAARHLGGRPLQIWAALYWPLLRGPLLTAFILLFLYSFGAYELPWILGESRPAFIALRITNDLFHGFGDTQARAYAGLTVVSFLCLGGLAAYLALTARRGYAGRRL